MDRGRSPYPLSKYSIFYNLYVESAKDLRGSPSIRRYAFAIAGAIGILEISPIPLAPYAYCSGVPLFNQTHMNWWTLCRSKKT